MQADIDTQYHQVYQVRQTELHFSQLIVRGVPVYVSLMALIITESSIRFIHTKQVTMRLFCFMVFSFPQILSTIKQVNDGCKHIVIVGLQFFDFIAGRKIV